MSPSTVVNKNQIRLSLVTNDVKTRSEQNKHEISMWVDAREFKTLAIYLLLTRHRMSKLGMLLKHMVLKNQV